MDGSDTRCGEVADVQPPGVTTMCSRRDTATPPGRSTVTANRVASPTRSLAVIGTMTSPVEVTSNTPPSTGKA